MKALYNMIWKAGQLFVRNEDAAILVDTLGAMQSLIMIRSEYPPILQHILEMCASIRRCPSVVVTSHPGIGV